MRLMPPSLLTIGYSPMGAALLTLTLNNTLLFTVILRY